MKKDSRRVVNARTYIIADAFDVAGPFPIREERVDVLLVRTQALISRMSPKVGGPLRVTVHETRLFQIDFAVVRRTF